MMCPALSIGALASHPVQTSAGIRFEIVHDLLWPDRPPLPRAHESTSHAPPTDSIRDANRAPAGHPARQSGCLDRVDTAPDSFFGVPLKHVADRPQAIGFQPDCGAGLRNRIRRRAASAKARKSDEISHGCCGNRPLPYGRGSAWRIAALRFALLAGIFLKLSLSCRTPPFHRQQPLNFR